MSSAALAQDLKGTTLVFTTYGGVVQQGETDAWVEPFKKQTGADVIVDGSVDPAKIKAQVDSGNVTWDVVEVDGYFGAAQCGKLFSELSSSVDKSELDPRYVTNPCGIPVVVNSAIFVYDKKVFSGATPSSWADFFDTKKFPGKRAMLNYPINGAIEAALLADGVDAAKLYPLDLDRAFRKLDTIKGDIVFTQSNAQLTETLSNNAVPLALGFNGRIYPAVKQGAPYVAVWNQNLVQNDFLLMMKGSQNQKASEAFLNYVAKAEVQARLVPYVPYSPATKDTKVEVDELLKSYLTNNPDNASKSIVLDQKWLGEHFDEISTRWTQWVSG
jgi:putative spermidine/putrescine transport system substrate-binding protein